MRDWMRRFLLDQPTPSRRPDPFFSHTDGGRAAGDCQRDVVGVLGYFLTVFAFDVVFGRGVPGCIRRWKLAVALYLRGASEIETQTPMRDVTVMADPVEQLPAAGVVVPAPVLGDARVDVGFGV